MLSRQTFMTRPLSPVPWNFPSARNEEAATNDFWPIGQENIDAVTDFLLQAITQAQGRREKIICFITGIPGAGKTLAGLNLVHNRDIHGGGRPASVFMSGNGPLVDILRGALALDCVQRTKTTRTRARSDVRTFV